ncbi:adenylate/guanylate cyclase domain-containing protein [Pantanalinema sp. GBBB05]|uniref:adenylate/guanylate cyclase domain-containing protein n=1 Tax=Pantanalinema sp. GBBB05 TaxID=2604139 RepID=UPI001D3A88F6|nr:response regulator [Pantanalinema sp. GBBB05]
MKAEQGSILIVDDVEANRDLLARRLQRQGHEVAVAEDGRQAIERLQQQSFDLVLCDIMMPEINGYQVLEHLKADPDLRHIPIIMISALDDIESVVRCIELGAEDYLFKPFNPTLLKARINASLEKKRLRDQEQAYLKQLQAEQEKSERLLLSILPKPVAEQLKQQQHLFEQNILEPGSGIRSGIAESFAEATVLFADIVDFTQTSSHRSPIEIVNLLNHIFSAFDYLAERHQLEKIKTIGDAYMVVGGVPTPRPDHAAAIAEMALDMQDAIVKFNQETGESFSIRIGISTGPVVAGVIGTKKFIYDLWGDTVNTASRMESQGLPNHIQVTAATYHDLHNQYQFEERGSIDIKGKGEMMTYWLKAKIS